MHYRPNSPGPLTDDSSVNFHDKFFLHFLVNFSKKWSKNLSLIFQVFIQLYEWNFHFYFCNFIDIWSFCEWNYEWIRFSSHFLNYLWRDQIFLTVFEIPTPKFHWNSDLMQVQGMGTHYQVSSQLIKKDLQFFGRVPFLPQGGIEPGSLNPQTSD